VTAGLHLVDSTPERVYQSNDTIFVFAAERQRLEAVLTLQQYATSFEFACHISGQLLPA